MKEQRDDDRGGCHCAITGIGAVLLGPVRFQCVGFLLQLDCRVYAEMGDRRYTRSAVDTVHLAPDRTECDCGQSRGVSIMTALGAGRSGVRFSVGSRDFPPKRTNRLYDPVSLLYS